MWHVGSQCPYLGSNLCTLQWMQGVLAARPPGSPSPFSLSRVANGQDKGKSSRQTHPVMLSGQKKRQG